MPFSRLRKFIRCRQGNIALVTALVAPVLVGAVAGAVDIFTIQHHRSELQNIADAAVLAAAREAGLKGWSVESAKRVAAAVIDSNVTNKFSGVTLAYDVQVDQHLRKIDLTLTQDHYAYFFLGYFTGSPQVGVRAIARATGQATICIITQAPNQSKSLALSGDSHVFASGCSAYSNSAKIDGVAVGDTSRLTTQIACSAGGYSGKPGNFAPLPITDCPTIDDPLAVRALLVDGTVSGSACNFKKVTLDKVVRTLTPGTYCGDLTIKGASRVSLQPGIYVIKDGKLIVDGASSIAGEGIGFVFVGEKAKLEFKNDSMISLSAPENGPMSGILIYAQRPLKRRDFKIESKDAEKLIGTVYLPGDQLVIGGDGDGDGLCDPEIAADGTVIPAAPGAQCVSDVGAASSWTAIVAYGLKVTTGSTLVLNSNYSGSTVPVPDGLGPHSGKLSLTR